MYTYPEACNAFESLANEFLKALNPGKRFRVYVTPDADCTTASVEWNDLGHMTQATIRLPVRPATARLTQAEFEDWTSYFLHEIGHPSFTDKGVWGQAVQAGLGGLVNALEDVRMEKAIITTGAVPNAKRVLSRLLDRKVAEARATGWKPNARKEFPWTVAVLGRAANGYDIDVSWVKAQLKAGSTVSKLLGWVLPALDACTSTAEVLKLAKKIVPALMQPKPKESKGKEGGKGEQGEEDQGSPQSEEDDEQGSEAGTREERTSEAPKAPDAPSEDNKAVQAGEDSEKDDSSLEGTENDAENDPDETPITNTQELEERSLAPQSNDVPGDIRERYKAMNITEILREAMSKRDPGKAYETGGRAYVNELRAAAAKSSKQRTLLARALKANESEDYEGGRRAGRLDRGALCRAVAGSQNVFGKRELVEGFDTDVHILVDASGSMNGNKMEAATETALIVAQAAASVGASYTVETFSQRGHTLAGPVAARSAPDISKFCHMARDAEGGTPLSSNMARAAIQQAKRAPGKRRVMFVITDGACDRGPEAVKGIADYVEKHCGTVLAHVSIYKPLTKVFKAEVRVGHGESIANIGLDHFVKVLQAL